MRMPRDGRNVRRPSLLRCEGGQRTTVEYGRESARELPREMECWMSGEVEAVQVRTSQPAAPAGSGKAVSRVKRTDSTTVGYTMEEATSPPLPACSAATPPNLHPSHHHGRRATPGPGQ